MDGGGLENIDHSFFFFFFFFPALIGGFLIRFLLLESFPLECNRKEKKRKDIKKIY